MIQFSQIVLNTTVVQADYDESLNALWMLLASFMVFFMHAGFSMLETGCVRSINAQAIMLKNLMVICVGFIAWYLIGNGLAYGANAGHSTFEDEDPCDPTKTECYGFAGTDLFLTNDFHKDPSWYRNWLFQGMC